jgi:hypothetical protein
MAEADLLTGRDPRPRFKCPVRTLRESADISSVSKSTLHKILLSTRAAALWPIWS